MSSQGFPPPDPRGAPLRSTFWQRFGLLDVLAFLGALGASLALLLVVPGLPRKAPLAPALLLLVARDRLAPSKPRVPKHGSSSLGVVLGLLLFGSVGVLAVSGLLFVNYFGPDTPDWDAEARTALTEARIRDRATNAARSDAERRREAEAAIAPRRAVWDTRHREALQSALQVFGAGLLMLGVSTAVQCWRTVPVDEVSGAR